MRASASSFEMQRANALPETALVISLVLMLLYGALQTALLGYTQISADGAAFVGGRTTVAHYSAPNASSDSTVQAFAANIAHSIFDRVQTTNVTVKNPDCATLETTVAVTMPGYAFFPGAKQFKVTGRDIEAQQPICASQNDLLGLNNVPKLPGMSTCPSLVNSVNLLGGNISQGIVDLTTQKNQLDQVVGDLDGLLKLVAPILTPSLSQQNSLLGSITNGVLGAVNSVVGGLLAPIVNGLVTPLLSGLLSPVQGVLAGVVQDAINGITPDAAKITGQLVSALSNILGPVLGALLGGLLQPLLQQIAQNLETTIFQPLFGVLNKVAGDHSIVSTVLNGNCS